MRRNQFLVIVLSLLSATGFSQGQLSDEASLRRIADGIMEENVRGFIDKETEEVFQNVAGIKPGLDLRLISNYSASYYPSGVINIAMMDLGELLGDQKYIDYTAKNIEFMFSNAHYFKDLLTEENHWELPFASLFEINYLDDCGAIGASIVDAYQESNKSEYRDYMEKTADFITTKQFRLGDGTLVRNNPVEFSLWADDLYMSVPFLARMGRLTGDRKYFDDAVKQVIQFTDYLWDEQTRLYFHSWHSDEEANGVAHWGRANGWVMMAQVELLKLLPKDHPQREKLLEIFKRQIRGIARYQSGSGLWHQLLDRVDSYEETSCTAMFTCGIAYAVNEGILPERYITVAQKGWQGILSKTDTDYQSSAVHGVCIGTGIQSDLNHYYTRPTRANDVGVGAVISAGVEIVRYNRSTVTSGLVAYYPFNGNANDVRNAEKPVIVIDAVLTSDRFDNANSAYAFDGKQSHIWTGVSDLPGIESEKSVSWWYYSESMPHYSIDLGAENMIVLVDSIAGIGIQFGFRASGYKTKGFDTWEWGGGTFLDIAYPVFNQWHFCVYTYDGVTHNFYLDGDLVNSSSVKPKSGIPNQLMFGNYPGGDQFFNGKLDDVRIYNRVLSESEVTFLFKQQ